MEKEISLTSWKKEFYKMPADKVSKKHAIVHSLRKWIGLRPCNRRKHHMSLVGSTLVNKSDTRDFRSDKRQGISHFDFDMGSCSLCCHYSNSCEDCPLVTCSKYDSPYNLFVEKGTVVLMIRALEKALKMEKQ